MATKVSDRFRRTPPELPDGEAQGQGLELRNCHGYKATGQYGKMDVSPWLMHPLRGLTIAAACYHSEPYMGRRAHC